MFVFCAGETFDITCFSGVNQYHTLRVEGECNAGQLSSCHIRCTDFEQQAMALADKDTDETFSKATRTMFAQSMVYHASIHAAWRSSSKENHKRISVATAVLQCTRENLEVLKVLQPDPSAQIVTVVIDVVTDAKHIHLVRESASKLPGMDDLINEEDGNHTDADLQDFAFLANSLAMRRTKDMVPYAFVASCIAPLADRCAAMGKELHLLMTGCNTINICPALLAAVPKPSQKSVWILCTSTKWPGDLATFLWHLYGSFVQVGDLQIFRQRTRALLGEYTIHFQRQRIEDASRKEKNASGIEGSLAEAVHLGCLDSIVIPDGRPAEVPLL